MHFFVIKLFEINLTKNKNNNILLLNCFYGYGLFKG